MMRGSVATQIVIGSYQNLERSGIGGGEQLSILQFRPTHLICRKDLEANK
jgi:hypothetical protein